ncbi:SusC/RagA family TonB-linked outer membrane protein [Chryseolinea sp. T2]|uniref:SusC/RagA family TonB-linked outer membrane protein n=1 Tax=Chryseolinea sp. T2 TaxID=3129255 RepID=UPI003077B464
MKKPLLQLIMLLLMCSASAVAQTTLTGTVTSGVDNAALPGVSVLVKGTTTGTTTDSDGKYSISVPDASSVLVFSFIGFSAREVTVGSQTLIDVSMSEDAAQLNEVVVTALGIPRATKTLVYATQSVKPSELTEVRDANNPLNSLQGKVANALIVQGSGGPGSGARIILRGNRSIQKSNNALIVVDGVPITNNTNSSVTSDFGDVQGSDGASNINPDDIESMTVLRGASAAVLYGSQGGNGAIVITTKKGRKDGGTSVNINSGVVFENPMILPALQNSYGQGNSGVLNANSGESWGAPLDGHAFTAYNGEQRPYSAQPDNIKDFFRTGVTWNNSVSIAGGGEKMQTYLSYTNNNVQGIMPRNDMNRNTVTLRLSNQISKRLSTDAKVTYILQDIDSRYRNGESLSAIADLYLVPRNVALSDIQNYQQINNVGLPEPTKYPTSNAALYENPYWIVNKTENNELRDRIFGYVSLKYDITPWLYVTGRVNLDKINDRQESLAADGSLATVSVSGGNYGRNNINSTQTWADLLLNGSNKFGEDWKLDYRLGGIYQNNLWQGTSAVAGGLRVPNFYSLNFGINPSSSQGEVETESQSVVAQATLAWKESIFLEGSYRTDWSSTLPAPHDFPYWSVGLSGIISDMVQLPSVISFLKLSGSIGEVGNGGQPQILKSTYSFEQGAGNGYLSRSPTYPIPTLKPELVQNVEGSLETKFYQNRLGVQFTYYKSNSKNQLLTVPVPVATGYTTQYINAGNIQNQGIELVVDATPVQGNLNWNIAFNLALNRNKIIELTPTVKEFSGGGYSRSATPTLRTGGSYGDLLSTYWTKTDDGQYIVNAEGKPVISTDQAIIGNFNPKATMGLTNTFTYKGVSLRALIDGRVGGIIVDGTEQLMVYNGLTEVSEQHREGGWNLGGVTEGGTPVDATITSQDFWQIASGGRYGTGDFFAYDATNFRLRELSLGYTIPLPESFVLKTARISLVGRNLFFLYRGSSKLDIPGLGKRKMSFDPDMSLGNTNWQGISYGTFPSTRSIGFNLQLTF